MPVDPLSPAAPFPHTIVVKGLAKREVRWRLGDARWRSECKRSSSLVSGVGGRWQPRCPGSAEPVAVDDDEGEPGPGPGPGTNGSSLNFDGDAVWQGLGLLSRSLNKPAPAAVCGRKPAPPLLLPARGRPPAACGLELDVSQRSLPLPPAAGGGGGGGLPGQPSPPRLGELSRRRGELSRRSGELSRRGVWGAALPRPPECMRSSVNGSDRWPSSDCPPSEPSGRACWPLRRRTPPLALSVRLAKASALLDCKAATSSGPVAGARGGRPLLLGPGARKQAGGGGELRHPPKSCST